MAEARGMANVTTTFRETQWFKLGKVQEEQQQAPAQDGDENAASATVLMLPIEDRYADRGDVTREDSRVFGLHTGTTEYIKLDKELAQSEDDVPMSSLVREMKRSKTKLFAIGASIAAACTAFAMYAI